MSGEIFKDDRQEYRHALVIFNTYTFPTATVVMRTPLSVYVMRTLPAILAYSPLLNKGTRS